MADAGIASRRKCKELILTGKVQVNEQIAKGPGEQVELDKDVIKVNGKRVSLSDEKIYLLLNKPVGYLSTTVEPRGGKTIMNLLPPVGKRLYPVGRLDKDTEGLLIITNNGDLTYLLTHPKHHVNKVYLAYVEGTPTDDKLDDLRRGIMLEDGMTAPALVERENCPEGNCLKITIHEGRKRQIRRMCLAIGYKVQRLKRIKLGTIELGDMQPGEYRYLTQKEIEELTASSYTFVQSQTT